VADSEIQFGEGAEELTSSFLLPLLPYQSAPLNPARGLWNTKLMVND